MRIASKTDLVICNNREPVQTEDLQSFWYMVEVCITELEDAEKVIIFSVALKRPLLALFEALLHPTFEPHNVPIPSNLSPKITKLCARSCQCRSRVYNDLRALCTFLTHPFPLRRHKAASEILQNLLEVSYLPPPPYSSCQKAIYTFYDTAQLQRPFQYMI